MQEIIEKSRKATKGTFHKEETDKLMFEKSGISFYASDPIHMGYIAGLGDGTILENAVDMLTPSVYPACFMVGEGKALVMESAQEWLIYDTVADMSYTSVRFDDIPYLSNKNKIKEIMKTL